MLVTGGAGFMGSWLVDQLIDNGHEVISADNMMGGRRSNINPRCKFVKADLRRRSDVASVVKGADVIFHLAAYAAEGQSIFSPISINEVNLIPMNNLLVEAVNNGTERFVFTSSMAVYGNQVPPFHEGLPRKPDDPYAAAKSYCESMLEILAEVHGFEFVILRPHNVYGPRQNIADPYRNVLGIWINRLLRGKPPIIYGHGDQTRAFSYIEDVTPAMVAAGHLAEARGQTINIGSDEVVKLRDACSLLLELMESNLAPVHEPPRPNEVKQAYCTVEKSVKVLGYQTKHSLREGLIKMIEWARRTGPQKPSYTLPLEITKGAPRVWVEKEM